MIDDYREETAVRAPAALREGTLARLGNAVLSYPVSFCIGVILLAAALASVFSLIVTASGLDREVGSPPSFYEKTPATSWFMTP